MRVALKNELIRHIEANIPDEGDAEAFLDDTEMRLKARNGAASEQDLRDAVDNLIRVRRSKKKKEASPFFKNWD